MERSVSSHNGFSVGDTIHIKRWYYAEGSVAFNRMGNCVMVDVTGPIDRITIDETDRDTIWCGKYSTSSADVANKGVVYCEKY